MDNLKKEPTPSQNKQEPIIENGNSLISFNQQQNNDFGLMDPKNIDHWKDEQEPILVRTNEIWDEIDKIIGFKYKWFKWQHIDLAKSDLSTLQDLKSKLNDMKQIIDQNINKVKQLRQIRQLDNNQFELLSLYKTMNFLFLCDYFLVKGKMPKP